MQCDDVHDVRDIGPMSEAYPHLIPHSFTSCLRRRVSSILKYLFPVLKEESRRVITFASQDDSISFRHHTCKKTDHKKTAVTETQVKCSHASRLLCSIQTTYIKYHIRKRLSVSSQSASRSSGFLICIDTKSIHDQAGHSGERKHHRSGVASASLLTLQRKQEERQRPARPKHKAHTMGK
ncbi:uncharacterized protein LOC121329239 isoform X2 [Polyodon spathula]|nr:uncharacterized protein LOC121329239 isoform X2 [Polyodon spathula]XP_041130664.1 uncharacterized protein LOC121329239 isoform X2 [Polyodon spathula]